MLNIILGKENLPKENFIYDIESYFPYVGIADNNVNKIILKVLEEGTYLSVDSFIDRYGFKISMLGLSTGSKVLIAIENTDKVINGVELGQNAFELLIQSIDGTIYFDNVNRFDLPEYFEVGNILVNGEKSETVLELENRLWKE